jgi:hypothetical protein
MEKNKTSLSEIELSKNNQKNVAIMQHSVLVNSDFSALNAMNLNLFKIISVAWRKSERLDGQIKKNNLLNPLITVKKRKKLSPHQKKLTN